MLSFLARLPFLVYKFLISPGIHFLAGPGYGCRFLPTCSEYSEEAIRVHGWTKGSWMTLRRLSRCHPFCKSGYDPVVNSKPASSLIQGRTKIFERIFLNLKS